jgi:hypothetical protein
VEIPLLYEVVDLRCEIEVTPKVLTPETRSPSMLIDGLRETIPEFTTIFVGSKDAIPFTELVANV